MAADIQRLLLILRIFMAFIAFFHLIVGGSLMLSVEAQRFFSELYGARVLWSDDIVYLIRVLGSFAFAFGVLALFAVINPLKNRVIGWGFVALFLLRDAQRHVFFSELERGFNLSPARNILTTMFFLAQAVALATVLLLIERRERSAQEKASQL